MCRGRWRGWGRRRLGGLVGSLGGVSNEGDRGEEGDVLLGWRLERVRPWNWP